MFRLVFRYPWTCDNRPRLTDVTVVRGTAAAAATAAARRVPNLLLGLAAAPSDQAAAARFRPFLLLRLMFVAPVPGSARRTGSGGRRRRGRVLRAPRRLGVADVRARPALQRARRLVFRPVQLPGQHQQALEQLAHVHVVLGRTLDQLDPGKSPMTVSPGT